MLYPNILRPFIFFLKLHEELRCYHTYAYLIIDRDQNGGDGRPPFKRSDALERFKTAL